MEEEKLIHLLFLSETPEQLGRELEGESDEEIQIEREKSKQKNSQVAEWLDAKNVRGEDISKVPKEGPHTGSNPVLTS
jgi:hypothetical protein